MKATVTVYNGHDRHTITGTVCKEYANGLTIEDDRGVRWYATNERVQREEILRGELF